MEFKTPKGTVLPLLDMRGKPYLQVAHRLVWFREEHPDWSIQTEMTATNTDALAKAIITKPDGQIMATAHKFEDKQGFGDYREKAETGAIGRALALCGFGTQFCADELEEGARVVDAPNVPAGRTAPAVSGDLAPVCSCGNKMMLSKYNPNEWYCTKCKAKVPRIA